MNDLKVILKAVGELICIAIVAAGLCISAGTDHAEAAVGWSAHE